MPEFGPIPVLNYEKEIRELEEISAALDIDYQRLVNDMEKMVAIVAELRHGTDPADKVKQEQLEDLEQRLANIQTNIKGNKEASEAVAKRLKTLLASRN